MSTILVVDDEKLVLTLLTRVLREVGYNVLTAMSGPEALGILARTHDKIDVLLTDLCMPEMGGFELAAKVSEAIPGIRIIYMTGYSDEAAAGRAMPGHHELLLKPFNRNSLLTKMMAVLPEAEWPQSRLMPRAINA